MSIAWDSADSSIYFASRDRYLYRYLHSENTLSRGSLRARPLSHRSCVGDDGKIYLYTEGRSVQALSPGLEEGWRYHLEGEPVGDLKMNMEGDLLITSRKGSEGRVSALSPSGYQRWSIALEQAPVAAPVLLYHQGEELYAVSYVGGRTEAYYRNGEQAWLFVSAAPVRSPVSDGERLFLPTSVGSVAAVAGDGTLIWKARLQSPASRSALSKDGRWLYIADETGVVYCFRSSDGQLITSINTGRPLKSILPAPSGDGLLITSEAGGIIWLSDEAKAVGRMQSPAASAQMIPGPDGTLLFGGSDWVFRLYRFPGSAGGREERELGEEAASFDTMYLSDIAKSSDAAAQQGAIEEIEQRLESGDPALASENLVELLHLFSEAALFSPIKRNGQLINDFPGIRMRSLELLSRYGNSQSARRIAGMLRYEWDDGVRRAACGAVAALQSDRDGFVRDAVRGLLRSAYRSSQREAEVAAASRALFRLGAYHGGLEEEDVELLLGVAYGPFTRQLRSSVLKSLRQRG